MKFIKFIFGTFLLLSTACSNEANLGKFLSYKFDHHTVLLIGEYGSLTVRVVTDDIFKITVNPGGITSPDTSYVVLHDSFPPVPFEVLEDDAKIRIISATTQLTIIKKSFRLKFEDRSGKSLLTGLNGNGIAWETGKKTVRFNIAKNEHFYGTGMRGDAFEKSGQKFDTYNRAQYGYNEALSTMSVNVPFYMSSNGYGVYFDNTFPGVFDFGKTSAKQFEYSAQNGKMVFYFIHGGNYIKTLERYTWLTGRQPVPPKWALGLLQSKYGYKSQDEVLEIAKTFRKKGIPLDALILDLFWFGFGNMGNINWSSEQWYDPAAMMSKLTSMGIITIPITEPYINETSANFDPAASAGYLVKDKSGQPYVIKNFWSGSSGLLDITSPKAASWWWEFHKSRMLEGVGGWWTDLGEPERHPADMVHEIGSANEFHNIYNLLWARVLFEKHRELYPNKRFFNLTRSGFAGIGRWGTFTWSGDVAKTFEGLSLQPTIMLNMAMSGIGYSHSDISGFARWTEPEEYARWIQYGVFGPIVRPHSSGQAVEPWQFGERVEKIAVDYIKLRYKLLPYIYNLAWENSTSGIPLTRPIILHYPDDRESIDITDEYLFGKDLLVAPVLSKGIRSRSVYFPEGTWIDWWTGEWHIGPKREMIDALLDRIPLFVKRGAIIPTAKQKDFALQSPDDTLTIDRWPESESKYTLYEDDGASLSYQSEEFSTTKFNVSVKGKNILIHKEPSIGSYIGEPEEKFYSFKINGVLTKPDSIRLNGELFYESSSFELEKIGSEGWWQENEILYINKNLKPKEEARFEVWNLIIGEGIVKKLQEESSLPHSYYSTATFPFEISNGGEANLFIYNTSGELLRTLRSAWTSPGNYSLFWDGRDEFGNSLQSGVYIYKFKIRGTSSTDKLLLIN